MAKSIQDLARDLASLGGRLDKTDGRHDRLSEKLDRLTVEKIIPTQEKVNQVHGIGKWAVPTVILLLVAIVGGGGRILYRLGEISTEVSGYTASLLEIQETTAELSANAIVSGPNPPQAVQEALTSPPDQENPNFGIERIAAVVDRARDKQIEVGGEAFESAAKNLLAVRPQTGRAWEVANRLAGYRSALNERLAPDPKMSIPVTSTVFPKWNIADQHTGEFLTALGMVPVSEAARVHKIGIQIDEKFGPEWVFVHPHEHTIQLDGYHYKNTVFLGITVAYSGGPILLENVYFVNCKFVVERSPTGERMVLSLVKPGPISFPQRG